MKVKITKENLKNAIETVSPAIAKLSTTPAIESVLFEACNGRLKITAYDFSIAITTPCECEVVEEGNCLIEGKLLMSIIKMAESPITIASDNSKVKISSGKSKYTLTSINPELFPETPVVSDAEFVCEISGEQFAKGAKKTFPFIKQTDTSPAVSGVYIEIDNQKINFVGCDGYHLVLASYATNSAIDNVSVVIPKDTARSIVNIINKDSVVKIYKGKRHHQILVNDTVIISRILSGSYLDWKAILKEPANMTTINCNLLGDAIASATPVVENPERNPIAMNIGDDIEISSRSALGQMTTRCPIQKPLSQLRIGVNSKLINDGLNACDNLEVKLGFNGATGPVYIEDENIKCIVLPMRLSQRS